MSDLLVVPGEQIEQDQLVISRARGVAKALSSNANPYARLLECRRADGSAPAEILIVALEVERPQHLAADIRDQEVVAIVFSPQDVGPPEVLALRPDFPQVPHLNLQPHEFPKSLCLFEQTWEEVRLGWRPGEFVERIRDWLRLTARGELHADDQALEPFLLSSSGTLVLSDRLSHETLSPEPNGIWIYKAHDGDDCSVFFGKSPEQAAQLSSPPFVAAVVDLAPKVHGAIHRIPSSLADLDELLAEHGDDLVGSLREQFGHWESNLALHEGKFVLIMRIPKSRTPGRSVEQVETWAFLSAATLMEVGFNIDIWQRSEGSVGLVLEPDGSKRGQSIELLPLKVV